jgi:signal transduction histidine kinase
MSYLGVGTKGRTLSFWSVLIISITLVFILIPASSAQEKEEIDVLYYRNSPFIYRSGTEVRGIAVDIMVPMMEQNGYSVSFKELEENASYSSLARGEGDLILGCNINVSVEDDIRYSEEVLYSNWGVLYSNEDFDVSTVMDLHRSWIGVVANDIYYMGPNGLKHLLDSFGIDAFIVEFGNYDELLDSIEDGDVDVGLLNSALGITVEHEHDIKRTSIVFSPIDVGIGVSSDNEEMNTLLKELDTTLGLMKDDPDSRYYRILEDYLTDNNQKPAEEIIPGWLLRTTLILIASVVLLVGLTLFLRDKVRSRTRQLEESNLMLEKDIKRRKEVEKELTEERNRSLFYLDLLIHDIGNIHQGLISHIQLHDMVKDDRDRSERNIKQMKELVDRSQVLVRNVHKFTDAIDPEKELEPVDIKPLILDSLRAVILSSPQMEIETDIDLPKEKMTVQAEPLIEDLFHNLFHNAVKFHRGSNAMVDLKAKKTDDHYEIEISDHGKGIPDSMKDTIFSRLELSTERKHRSMGLTLVRVLVRRYGGTVDVKDRVRGEHTEGTAFFISSPVHE